MSSAAAKVAPDLSRFDSRPQVREAYVAAAATAEAPAIRVLPAPRTHTLAEPRAHLSLRSVLVFLCVSALMVLIIYSYIQMAEMNQASREVLSEISQLQKEEAQLQQEKTQLVDMREIERIAEEELGMVRPSEGQIVYIDLSGEDHAEVPTE